MKPTKVWMVHGPKGLLTYYGASRTKKEMLKTTDVVRTYCRGTRVKLEIIRVLVTPVKP